METPAVNVIDLAIVGILVLSGALAFFRGVVRELFFVAGLIGAGAATYYGFAYVNPYARELIDIPLIDDAAAALLIFVVTLVVVLLIGGALSRRVREIGLGALDRSLGFLFGLARGALLVCIAYVVMTWALPPDEQPEWLREARAMPLVEYGAGLVVLAIPPEARAEWAGAVSEAKGAGEAAFDAQKALEILMSPPPAIDEQSAPGYTSAERRELERLIQGTQ